MIARLELQRGNPSDDARRDDEDDDQPARYQSRREAVVAGGRVLRSRCGWVAVCRMRGHGLEGGRRSASTAVRRTGRELRAASPAKTRRLLVRHQIALATVGLPFGEADLAA